MEIVQAIISAFLVTNSIVDVIPCTDKDTSCGHVQIIYTAGSIHSFITTTTEGKVSIGRYKDTSVSILTYANIETEWYFNKPGIYTVNFPDKESGIIMEAQTSFTGRSEVFSDSKAECFVRCSCLHWSRSRSMEDGKETYIQEIFFYYL